MAVASKQVAPRAFAKRSLTVGDKKALIAGEWVESESGRWIEVLDKGTGEVMGRVPSCTPKDVDRAVEAAKEGHKALAALSVKERIQLLYKAFAIGERRAEEMSLANSMEVGKTIAEAREEVIDYALVDFTSAAESMKRFRGTTHPSIQEATNNKRIYVTNEPLGVVAVFAPWNWPSDIPNIAAAPALAMGNAVIFKPASYSPFSPTYLAEIYDEAGFPKGSVQTIPGPGPSTGSYLAAHPGVDGIHFTGSTEVGEDLHRNAGLKRMCLELGGNGPMVIMDDANIDAAVAATATGCFYMAGQVCTASERVLVHKDVYKEFVGKLVEAAKAIKLGDPLDPSSDMGPLNNQPSADKVIEDLEDAKAKGAEFLVGGDWDGLYFEPAVIEGVTGDMLVAQEETFGPVAPLMIFNDADEAIEIANSTPYGLTAAVFTSGLKNAFYLGEGIKAGTVHINETTNYWDQQAPFGGRKKSGLGRELSDWILAEVSEPKQITFDLSKVKE